VSGTSHKGQNVGPTLLLTNRSFSMRSNTSTQLWNEK